MEPYEKIPILAEAVTTYRPAVKLEDLPRIARSSDVAELVADSWDGIYNYETVKALFLNKKNCVLGIAIIGQGGIAGCPVDVRLILQKALTGNAVSVILIHNHPSGNHKPSIEDIALTARVNEACNACDLKLLDHVIIVPEGTHFSFADECLYHEGKQVIS